MAISISKTASSQQYFVQFMYENLDTKHTGQHKSKKYKRQVHNKTYKTENYKIDSKRTLQQYTPKKQKSVNSAQVIRL